VNNFWMDSNYVLVHLWHLHKLKNLKWMKLVISCFSSISRSLYFLN